jgi:hypothetical protein
MKCREILYRRINCLVGKYSVDFGTIREIISDWTERGMERQYGLPYAGRECHQAAITLYNTE